MQESFLNGAGIFLLLSAVIRCAEVLLLLVQEEVYSWCRNHVVADEGVYVAVGTG